MNTRVVGSVVCLIGVVLALGTVADAELYAWQDPGFEMSADLVNGPWTTGSMRTHDGTAWRADWDFALEPTGGNPNANVHIIDAQPNILAYALVGQHIQLPKGADVTSAEVSLDALRYCPNANRRGPVGFILMTADEWARISPAQQLALGWNQVDKLWDVEASAFDGDDVQSWTHPDVHQASADPVLATMLENHAGEDLVLAAYYAGFHAGSAEDAHLDNVQATIEYTAPTGIVASWKDPGFETTIDFSTGPWEVGEARSSDPYVSEWDISLPTTGGAPDRYVSMDDSTDATLGSVLLGQHITVPEANDVVSADIQLDVQKYCAHDTRGGGIAFALFTAAEWDKMDPALSGLASPKWDDIAKLWEATLWEPSLPYGGIYDFLDWTHGTLPAADAAALVGALNANKGQNLVLATRFFAWHVSHNEWCKVDNFRATVAMTPEPTSLALLGLGALALVRRRRA